MLLIKKSLRVDSIGTISLEITRKSQGKKDENLNRYLEEDNGMDIGHGRHAATWWRFLEKNGVQHVKGKHAQNKRKEGRNGKVTFFSGISRDGLTDTNSKTEVLQAVALGTATLNRNSALLHKGLIVPLFSLA